MFDLFRSQRKAVKYVLTFLLSMVALSMVVTLIPNVFSGQPDPTGDFVLAEVGDHEVTITELQAQLAEYARANTPRDAMAYMANQIIGNLIEEKVLISEAERLGVKPDDRELAIWLKDQMPFLWQTGEFNSVQYRQIIQQRFNQTVPQFEQNVLKDLTIETRLRDLVTDNVLLSEEQLKEAYQDRNEMAKIDYVLVDAADFASQVSTSDEKIQEYFEQNKLRYRTEEMRVVKEIQLTAANTPVPEPTDAQIRSFYQQNRERFQTPERIFARHILLTTMDPNTQQALPEEEIANKEAKAQEALEKLNGGADFAEVSAEYSEDPGTKDNGGELGWVMPGQYGDEKLDGALFNLEAGERSGVVRSAFGFHIFQADQRDEAQTRGVEQVRDEIVADLKAEQRQLAQMQRTDQALAALRKSTEDNGAALRDMGVPVATYGPFGRRNAPRHIAEQPTYYGNVMSSALNEPITFTDPEGVTRVAIVSEIVAPRDPEFSEVAETIREDYVEAESRKLARARADELLAAAKESNLADAARKFNQKVETSDFFKRSGTVEGFTSAQSIGNAAFDAAVGTVHGPVAVGAKIGVYAVADHAEADMSGFIEEREKLRDDRLTVLRDEVFNIFRSETVQRYLKEGKIKRYEDRIEAVMNNIRRG